MATEEFYEAFKELHAATATEDASRLGKLFGEKSSYVMKKYAKKALKRGVALGGALAAPATLNLSNMASAAILGGTAGASAGKTDAHIEGLREIQNDLVEGRAHCSCNACLEAVGFTISAKQTKSKVKKGTAAMQAAGAAVPAGSLVAAGISAGAGAWVAGGSEAGNFKNRKSRKALAGDLHRGARGAQTEGVDGLRFDNGCLPARAIIEELTGHWARVTFATNGDAIVADKMQST